MSTTRLNPTRENAADIVLLNGKVITVNPENVVAEAVAIKGNRILSVGKTDEIKRLVYSNTKTIELEGRAVLPGFIDAHAHLEDHAANLTYPLRVFVPPLKSVKDILKKIEERAAKTTKGEWILALGGGHFGHRVEEKRYVTKTELDQIAPDNPVVLDAGFHQAIVNSKALEAFGITKDTPRYLKDPDGGWTVFVYKDPSTGEPTGKLGEPHWLFYPFTYKLRTHDEVKEAMRKVMMSAFIEQGITTIHEISGPKALKAYQEFLTNNELPLRVRFYIDVKEMQMYGLDIDDLTRLGLQSGFGNEWLKLGGIKLFADGGSPNAAIYEPSAFDVHYFGLLHRTQEELNRIYVEALKVGLQVITHTVGEKAQDMVLNAIQAALYELPKKDHRYRLEHAGNYFATPERMQRMLELGAIPVTTPQFLSSIGPLLEGFYGKRISKLGLYPYKMLLDMGFKLPFSSDCTGVSLKEPNPFYGIWLSVTRKTPDGTVVEASQRISVMDAIRCYTINAAYAGFEENVKGSIEPGKLADLIVVSKNPLSIPVDEIRDLKVEMTIIDGKIVYKSEDAP